MPWLHFLLRKGTTSVDIGYLVYSILFRASELMNSMSRGKLKHLRILPYDTWRRLRLREFVKYVTTIPTLLCHFLPLPHSKVLLPSGVLISLSLCFAFREDSNVTSSFVCSAITLLSDRDRSSCSNRTVAKKDGWSCHLLYWICFYLVQVTRGCNTWTWAVCEHVGHSATRMFISAKTLSKRSVWSSSWGLWLPPRHSCYLYTRTYTALDFSPSFSPAQYEATAVMVRDVLDK